MKITLYYIDHRCFHKFIPCFCFHINPFLLELTEYFEFGFETESKAGFGFRDESKAGFGFGFDPKPK